MRRSESKGPPGPIRSGTAPSACAALVLSVLVLPLCTGCTGPALTFPSRNAEAGEAKGTDPTHTGSIGKPPKNFGEDLDDEDWRRAYGAMAVALDPQGNGKPVKWENPDTTLRGTVSPTGLPYVTNDEVCRDFLASVIAPRASRFVRGTGCKPAGGDWHLKRMRSAKEPGIKGRGAKA